MGKRVLFKPSKLLEIEYPFDSFKPMNKDHEKALADGLLKVLVRMDENQLKLLRNKVPWAKPINDRASLLKRLVEQTDWWPCFIDRRNKKMVIEMGGADFSSEWVPREMTENDYVDEVLIKFFSLDLEPVTGEFLKKYDQEFTDKEKADILAFISTYGYPFIPYRQPEPADDAFDLPYSFYGAFKLCQIRFKRLCDKLYRGTNLNDFDLNQINSWLNGEITIFDSDDSFELAGWNDYLLASNKRGIAFRVYGYKIKDNGLVALSSRLEYPRNANFLLLVRYLDTHKPRRLIGTYLKCRYCGKWANVGRQTKYLKFSHCQDPECVRQAKNDIRKYKLKTDPAYKAKTQEASRKRQKKFRLQNK